MIRPKPHLIPIARTPEEKESRLPYLRLEKNERLVPFPDPVLARFRELLTPDAMMAYPELEPLYQKLAQYLKVGRDELFLAAGSDLGIKTVYETYISPGDRVVLHTPSYAMQEVYCKIFQAKPVYLACNQCLELDVQAFCDLITPGTRMVVLENPNGFTGMSLPLADVETIVKKAQQHQAIAIIDEAYYLFSSQSVQALYKKYDNVIITRTFSKDLGIAGLRCAYLLTQAANVESLFHVKPMHEINSAAVAFVLASLDFPESIGHYVKEVQDTVRSLRQAFADQEITTAGGSANFVTVHVGDAVDFESLTKKLKSQGVLIRRPPESARGWIRITIGTAVQMKTFMTHFLATLRECGWRKETLLT